MSTFDAKGPVAERQLILLVALFWICLVVFILVVGALLYAAIKFREKPGQGLPKQVHGNTKLEITDFKIKPDNDTHNHPQCEFYGHKIKLAHVTGCA